MAVGEAQARSLVARVPAVVLEAGVVLGWSSGFIGAVLASATPSIFGVLFWRFAIISLALSPWLWGAVRRGLGPGWWLTHLSLGALGMFLCLVCGIAAIDQGTPAGTAALIGALQPLATAVLAGPILGERVRLMQWLGLFIGLGGVAVAVGEVSAGNAVGYVLAFASMLAIVLATLIAKARWDGSDFLTSFAVQASITAVLTLPLAVADNALWPEVDWPFAAAVAWAVLFATTGAYGLYYLCLQRSSAVRVGSLIYLTPPVTMVWAWAMFGEAMTVQAIAGFGICIIGVWLARARG